MFTQLNNYIDSSAREAKSEFADTTRLDRHLIECAQGDLMCIEDEFIACCNRGQLTEDEKYALCVRFERGHVYFKGLLNTLRHHNNFYLA